MLKPKEALMMEKVCLYDIITKKNDNTIRKTFILNISFSGLKNVAVYFMLMIFLLKICELIFNFVNPVIE